MKKILPACACFAIALCPTKAADSLQHVFSDSEFHPSEWFFELGAWGGGDGFSTQELLGGNPGAYTKITLSMTAGEGGVGFHGFHSTAVYDPSTHGAIASVSFSEDLRMISGSLPGMSSGSALLQNGLRYYRWCWETDSMSWTTRNAAATGAGDYLLDHLQNNGQNPPHPDFSSTGAPITFGFFRNIQGTAGTDFSSSSGLDNWSTTVTTVPEPSTVWLVALGTLFLLRSIRASTKK